MLFFKIIIRDPRRDLMSTFIKQPCISMSKYLTWATLSLLTDSARSYETFFSLSPLLYIFYVFRTLKHLPLQVLQLYGLGLWSSPAFNGSRNRDSLRHHRCVISGSRQSGYCQNPPSPQVHIHIHRHTAARESCHYERKGKARETQTKRQRRKVSMFTIEQHTFYNGMLWNTIEY